MISNVALVLQSFQNQLKAIYPTLKVAYEQNVNYENGVVRLRSDNLIQDWTEDHFPAFIYNRNFIRPATTRRAAKDAPYDMGATQVKLYTSEFATIPINFMCLFTSPIQLEEFEISYYADKGIFSVVDTSVDLSNVNLGLWHYQIIWD